MAKPIEDTTCGRCGGKGELPCFRHVLGGICFRCWGCGVDPKTADQLRAWLERARIEFKGRSVKLAECKSDSERKRLEREVEMITKMGKANRARLEKLEASVRAGRAWAKARTA